MSDYRTDIKSLHCSIPCTLITPLWSQTLSTRDHVFQYVRLETVTSVWQEMLIQLTLSLAHHLCVLLRLSKVNQRPQLVTDLTLFYDRK